MARRLFIAVDVVVALLWCARLAAACGLVQAACPDPNSCCAGLSCQPWVFKIGDVPSNHCCYELGRTCATTNDCCGVMQCTGGQCVCQPDGQPCLRDADCCLQEYCVGQKCTKVTLTAQQSGNDALSLVNWSDGHAELFARAPDGSLVHATSTTLGTWTLVDAAATIAADAACGPAALFLASGPRSGTALIATGKTGGSTQLASSTSGGWSAASSLGGVGLSHLSSLVWPDGHAELLALGADQAIWHDVLDLASGKWSGWSTLGGIFVTGAGTMVWADGHTELFTVDGAGAAWHTYASGVAPAFGVWTSLGGQLASRVVPVRFGDGHLAIFARGKDGKIYWSNWNAANSWPAFSAISPTVILGEPSAIYGMPATAMLGPEVFARDASGQIGHAIYDGTRWSAWTSLGQAAASDPFAWVRKNGEVELFAIDPFGNLVHSARPAGGTWEPWTASGAGLDACAEQLSPLPDGGPGGVEAGVHDAAADGPTKIPSGGGHGCGCQVGGARAAPSLTLLGLLLGALWWLRRRSSL